MFSRREYRKNVLVRVLRLMNVFILFFIYIKRVIGVVLLFLFLSLSLLFSSVFVLIG